MDIEKIQVELESSEPSARRLDQERRQKMVELMLSGGGGRHLAWDVSSHLRTKYGDG